MSSRSGGGALVCVGRGVMEGCWVRGRGRKCAWGEGCLLSAAGAVVCVVGRELLSGFEDGGSVDCVKGESTLRDLARVEVFEEWVGTCCCCWLLFESDGVCSWVKVGLESGL